MKLSKHEQFTTLLDHISYKSSDDNFLQGQILNLIIHKESKRWEFQFEFPALLSFETFLNFQNHLTNQFKEIAQISYRIQTTDDNSHIDGKLVTDYWSWVIKNSSIQSSFIRQICDKSLPSFHDNQLDIKIDNDVTQNFIDDTTVQSIQNTYQNLGFPKFAIKTVVDANSSADQMNQFKEEMNKRDQALAQRATAAIQQQEKQRKSSQKVVAANGAIQIGKPISDRENPTQLRDINQEERSVVIEGYIFDVEIRTLRSERQLLIFKMTDYTSSMTIKKFSRNEEDEALFANVQKGKWVRVRGSVQEDTFMRDLTLNAYDVTEVKHAARADKAEDGDKRVELHVHTNMSQMDATNSISDFVGQAAKWHQPAIAVTDHAGLQAFPEAYAAAKKNDIRMLFGVEANLVDDGVPIGYNNQHVPLKGATYVVFDVETTGLSAIYDKVIELSAVKMQDGNVIGQFEEFIDPGFPLSDTTINLTSITNEMVHGSKSEKEVFELFREFYGDAIIVGHNVTFDIGFMNTGYLRHDLPEITNPIIDTLTLARFLYPTLKGYRLNTLAKKFDVSLEHHHRAIYDAESTGHLCYLFLKDAEDRYGIEFHDQLNDHMSENDAYKHARPNHVVILVKNQTGLKNLFKLVSLSNIKYYYRVPRIPRSQLEKYREGLIVGSACSSGEVFTSMMQKGYSEARQKAKFYDYLEVMPKPVYQPLIDQELVRDNKRLEEIIKNIVKLGDELDKPVVATGDVHYLNPEDYIYRKILIHSQGGANPLNRSELPDVHFRSTDEMLEDFSFLGEEVAHKIVVENTQEIANSIDDVSPVKEKLYTPKVPGAEDRIKQLTMDQAHALYGDELPEIVSDRLDKELTSIIGNGFSVIYLIAQRLVHKSNKDGYLVGSRGSVGSSLVATMSGITEVNPLPPHYRCPDCQYSEFYTKGEYGSGFDLPDKKCPKCGALMIGDGQDIPFETFLGFKGDKVPDIDLNFSGDYQPIAHNYMQVLFGKENVFRAGTIGTVADKTAYGYVKAYERDTNAHFRGAEIDRLAKGATGVKRTTGQHPAGILIVPDYMDIYDFSPIQYPADDQTSAWETTHFDFHSIHDNILKMDILGHDDPTMIRKLQDLSGIEPKSIPTDDPEVMKIFSGPDVLGVDEEQIQSKTGTLGIPEFGTRFVRGMLEETHPTTYSELLQISGLSHGTDVWLGNAEELIKNGTVTLKEVIGCRDNIMMDLIHYGLDSQSSFQIMESVRKGKGIPEGFEAKMREANVPGWYIESCGKIKYMFPRAHASAYILMALRIAYFKVYFPLVYYAAYFSVRADDFDVVAMSHGKESVKAKMQEINDKGNDASTKEKNLLTVLELANEMLERGFDFKMVDIEKSDAQEWLMDGNTLIAPFNALPGLGLNVAKQIVAARADKPFLSKEDLAKRGHVSGTLIEFMTENNVLTELPDENQLSLF
ncbi:PolC-type DNA polymerase III [Pediococcus argentinicus]|uniref:DNA polymerase III PolC-type n=1 Tax=Pediococcus argentinicus TaxID=480391 RepID=A0A0R2NKH7_9LACO|nr:PolC-type DNA polymerase III [Pediococcus argentinicus]KRO26228.1 polC protein [Pediococcus argentinicus]NKZ21580.1 PolC-type DNA polymerase III [Pediococcus argentinicus]GEP18621.1 DNA polymerase III PolC-type [Pediococcus argentinicus]